MNLQIKKKKHKKLNLKKALVYKKGFPRHKNPKLLNIIPQTRLRLATFYPG